MWTDRPLGTAASVAFSGAVVHSRPPGRGARDEIVSQPPAHGGSVLKIRTLPGGDPGWTGSLAAV